MDPLDTVVDPQLRRQLSLIREWYGRTLPSSELQAAIKGFGSQKGIYKPSGSRHALWVRQTAKGVYPDRDLEFRPDGSWTYLYSPEGRIGKTDLALDTNKALLRASEDRVPVGVFRQVEDEHGKTTYQILGLAFVEGFDGSHFRLRGEGIDIETTPLPEVVVPTFQPFEVGPAKVSESIRALRDRRFGVVVQQLYHERCSLCNLGFRVRGNSVGLEAAHIIPVEQRGVLADVRNGILLCRNHHALFDTNAWTMDEDLRIRVAPDQSLRRSALPNHLLGAEGKRLPNLPNDRTDFPAAEAVKWRIESFERTWGSRS